jgi:predicted nucleotidyltransferase
MNNLQTKNLYGKKEGQYLVFKNIPIKNFRRGEQQLKTWIDSVRKSEQEIEETIEVLRKVLFGSFKEVGLHSDTEVAISFMSHLQKTTAVRFIRDSENLNQFLVDVEDFARLWSKDALSEDEEKKKKDLELGLVQNTAKYPLTPNASKVSASNPESRLAELARFRNVVINGTMHDGRRIADAWSSLILSRNSLRESLIKPKTFRDSFDESQTIELKEKDSLRVKKILDYPIILDLDIDTENSVYELVSSLDNLTPPNWFLEPESRQPTLPSSRQPEAKETVK